MLAFSKYMALWVLAMLVVIQIASPTTLPGEKMGKKAGRSTEHVTELSKVVRDANCRRRAIVYSRSTF